MVVVVNDGVDMMKEGVNQFEEKDERVRWELELKDQFRDFDFRDDEYMKRER